MIDGGAQPAPEPASFTSKFWGLLRGPTGLIAGLVFLLAATAWVAQRTQAHYAAPSRVFDFSQTGMSDFHNGAYFPSRAFASGVNPYAEQMVETYPVSRSAPPYSPLVFILHQPWSWLPLPAADILYFLSNWLLLGCLAWFLMAIAGRSPAFRLAHVESYTGLATLVWLFGWLVISRPGHITLFTGYFTVQLVFGVVLAVHFGRTRPLVSGIGMLLASGKPTYWIPLVILMVARRNLKATMIGAGLTGLVVAGGLGWLAMFSDFQSVIAGIGEGQAAFANDPTEAPINTWTRLDIAGVLARCLSWTPGNSLYLVAMLLMLVPVGICVRRLSATESSQGGGNLSAVLIYTAILVTLYHHSYDGLLALAGAALLALGGRRLAPELNRGQRWCAIALLSTPGWNYFATLRFREWAGLENHDGLWTALTAINGLSLLAGMLILMIPGFRAAKSPAA